MLKFCLILLLAMDSSFAIDWQGHRGARGLYPENTIGGMEVALKYPISTLELDVVISGDEKVIVSHEPWMSKEICVALGEKKIKGKEYNIYKMSVEEIVKFNCGSLPHPRFPRQAKVTVGKPTLEKLLEVTEETLRKLDRTSVKYSIEIKSDPLLEKQGFQPEYKKFSDLVMASIKKIVPENRFMIQSFDWRVLRYIHEKYPSVALVALKEGEFSPEKALKDLGFTPTVFSPYFKELKASDVKKFHELNVQVIPWTVNEVSDMQSLIQMNVDGIITDYPDLIIEIRSLECGDRKSYFEGKCVTLPAHAVPSSSNPGWTCKEGYIQKRGRCIEIQIPRNAVLLPDGKNWACNKGFRKYRSTCVKE